MVDVDGRFEADRDIQFQCRPVELSMQRLRVEVSEWSNFARSPERGELFLSLFLLIPIDPVAFECVDGTYRMIIRGIVTKS